MSFLVLFSRSFRRILFFFFGVLFNFLEGFSPLALHLLLLAFFVGLSLFLFILISLEILSTNLNYNNFLPWTRYKKYLALRVFFFLAS